jgi:DnaJ like chaperone protein
MGAAKWIGGIIGFMSGGPLGALAGYALGALLDNAINSKTEFPQNDGQGGYNPYNGQSGYAQNYGQGGYAQGADYDPLEGNRTSFRFALLVMASYIIRADGRIMHSEMEYVRTFLRVNFGEEAAQEGNDILLRLFEQRKEMERNNPNAFTNTIRQCAAQLAYALTYEQRLQLLAFLCGIAKADGQVSPEEVDALKEVARYMQLQDAEVDSLLNLGGKSLEEAYKVLEISPEATDQEVRSAYRKLAMKHHPDRVAALGDDVKKAAEEKSRQINDAKDKIYTARGMQ